MEAAFLFKEITNYELRITNYELFFLCDLNRFKGWIFT
ncbi:hypothetical protein SAMN05428949_4417 [Chitinophaga sp. YR627]|nr:hypothetical protein SAMN05428949_4417 [Chitinophaga sp. YR627]